VLVDSHPEGYPRLAAFLDSDDSFMIFKRFGYLQTRILLEKQAQLQLLERELDETDAIDNETREGQKGLQSFQYRNKRLPEQLALIRRIEQTFCEYC
jgi:hypothetical protein